MGPKQPLAQGTLPRCLVGGKIRDHRLSRYSTLTDDDQGCRALWQIYVDTAAEANHSKALSRTYGITLFDVANDAPRDKPCDLNEGQHLAVRRLDRNGIAFVFFRCLVERSIQEFAIKYICEKEVDRSREMNIQAMLSLHAAL